MKLTLTVGKINLVVDKEIKRSSMIPILKESLKFIPTLSIFYL